MKSSFLAKLIVPNLIILFFLFEVLQDNAGKAAYWTAEGFSYSTSYGPFFFVTSATRGATYIAGLVTLDWVQVLLVSLVLLNLSYLIPYLRTRSNPARDFDKIS